MTCASCVHHIEKTLLKSKGVYGVLVGLMIEKAEVRYGIKETNPENIVECIKQLGYEAEIIEKEKESVEIININV